MSLVGALAATLGAAGGYGVASALQGGEATRALAERPGVRGLLGLVKRPLWLLGVLADIVGLALHVLALTLGPVSLVQPLQVTGLLLALPLSRRLRGLPFRWRGEIVPALLIVFGLGVFLALTRPGEATASLGFGSAVSLLAAIAAVQVVTLLMARGGRGVGRTLALSAAAGAAFAVTAVLIDSLARQRRMGGWSVLLSPHAAVLIMGAIGIGFASLAVSQLAFQAGPLAHSLPTITVVDPLVAVLLGGLLLGETPRLTPLRIVLDCAAMLGVIVGVAALTRVTEGHNQSRLTPVLSRAARLRWRRLGVAGLAAAAGVGAAYGMLPATVAALLDHRLDGDDGAGVRLVILGCCVTAAAVANVFVQNHSAARR